MGLEFNAFISFKQRGPQKRERERDKKKSKEECWLLSMPSCLWNMQAQWRQVYLFLLWKVTDWISAVCGHKEFSQNHEETHSLAWSIFVCMICPLIPDIRSEVSLAYRVHHWMSIINSESSLLYIGDCIGPNTKPFGMLRGISRASSQDNFLTYTCTASRTVSGLPNAISATKEKAYEY